MKTSRTQRISVALLLYASLLLASLVCAVGHGQMAGLALSGLNGSFCSSGGDSAPAGDMADLAGEHSAGSDCVLCASFSAQLLAALFGLLLALAVASTWPWVPDRLSHGYAWPPGRPRAPPLLA
jgi:hypothetical protein